MTAPIKPIFGYILIAVEAKRKLHRRIGYNYKYFPIYSNKFVSMMKCAAAKAYLFDWKKKTVQKWKISENWPTNLLNIIKAEDEIK